MKAAVVVAAVMAGLLVSVAPAEAAQCKGGGGALYICEYGVTENTLYNGEEEEFLIGLDSAVWTRMTHDGDWGAWKSLGGVARSGVTYTETAYGTISVWGTDGAVWRRGRTNVTDGWTAWERPLR
ncbi:hypothetical protein [Streptomyces sp. NPDC058623]|uniref:hypothetical protein n=1 Tax=Streptomyces sp. NPDC058623 TaxID=3346563 RepID=UPI00364F2A73